MATTKLHVLIDELAHKVITAEEEVAVGETFDLLFVYADGWEGRTVNVTLFSADGTPLWRLNKSVEKIEDETYADEAVYGVKDCVIDTEEAVRRLDFGCFNSVLAVFTDGAEGERTVYGATPLKVHPGMTADGTPLAKFESDLERHNVDETAHADIRDAITKGDDALAEAAGKALKEHANAEEVARNEAIHNAIRKTYQEIREKLQQDIKDLCGQYVEEQVNAHAERKDNPHEVTAAQVPYGEAEDRNATLAGADNWNGAWGFDLDLKTLDAAAWEGVDPETAVKVSEICLRVSEHDYTGDLVWLELTGTDGKVWVSQDEPSWVTRGAEVPYRFEPAAELPGGVIAARFVTTNGKGVGHAMPLRVSKVSATETPAGCDVWTADKGTSKRTDFAPCVVRLDYSFPATVAVALGNLESGKADAGHLHDDRYLRLTGGTLRGNVNASGSVTIKVPILNATNYFSTPMLCNEPGLYAKNHALLLGYAYHDYWEFLENGGDYRFYLHQETNGTHKQVARITPSGIYEGTTLLANKYAAKSHTHTQAQVTGLADALQDVKDYADQRVSMVYRFKGSVATEADLPKSGNVTGDVWNVEADGQNWAWDGSKWDSLRGIVDLSVYSTTEQMNAAIAEATEDKAEQADLDATDERVSTLEEQMGDLLYKAIAFTGGSATPGEAEIGASVASVVLKWSTNKTPTTLALDGTALGTTETTRTMTGPFTTNKTWALKATDERGATATRNLALTFKNKVYWGVGTATGAGITDAFVLGLSGKQFATGRGRTFTANAGAGQYIYYVFPKAWGTPTFKVGGFEGGFALDREWEHTNASGGKVQYQAWRSTNASLGNTTVVVS